MTSSLRVLQATEVPGLRILTAGTIPGNPAELLGSQRIKSLLATLRAEAEHIVIDTAPVGVVTDAALLAADADATVLVVRESFSSERVVRRGRDALAAVNAHLVGVVLNWMPYQLPGWVSRALTRTPDEPATYKILTALLAFPAFWIAEAAAAGMAGGVWAGLAMTVIAPATGYVALLFHDRLEAVQG